MTLDIAVKREDIHRAHTEPVSNQHLATAQASKHNSTGGAIDRRQNTQPSAVEIIDLISDDEGENLGGSTQVHMLQFMPQLSWLHKPPLDCVGTVCTIGYI